MKNIFLALFLIYAPMASVFAEDCNCRCDYWKSAGENKIFSELDDQKRLKFLKSEISALEERIKVAQIERDKRILDAEIDKRARVIAEQKIKEERSRIENRILVDVARQESLKTNDHKSRIIAKIRRNIVMPPDIPYGAISEYLITLAQGGMVVNAELIKSSGAPAYDLAVERAIRKSQPLPLPPDPEMFSAFRELYIRVSPKE